MLPEQSSPDYSHYYKNMETSSHVLGGGFRNGLFLEGKFNGNWVKNRQKVENKVKSKQFLTKWTHLYLKRDDFQ